jgi:hypothetical protein
MTFGGFEFTYTKPAASQVKPAADEAKSTKVDVSLDDLVAKSVKSDREARQERGRRSSRQDSDRRPKQRVIDLHLPRDMVNQLCADLGIDTKGYFVRVEAVLT